MQAKLEQEKATKARRDHVGLRPTFSKMSTAAAHAQQLAAEYQQIQAGMV